MTDFVTVASYTNPVDARIGKSALEARGISAYILGEHTASMHLPGVDGVSGIELKVPGNDYQTAKALLQPLEDDTPRCPICGSDSVRPAYNVLHALALELFGRSTREIISRRQCNACGHKWLTDLAQ